jgi:hypothetical protein
MTALTADVVPASARPRSRVGVIGFVIVIVALIAPIVAGIVAVVSGVRDASFGDDASAGGWAVSGGPAVIGLCLIPAAWSLIF